MSLNWSTNSPSVTIPEDHTEAASKSSLEAEIVPAGHFSPPQKLESTAPAESANHSTVEGSCASIITANTDPSNPVYAESSLLSTASVDKHSVASMAGIKTEMQPLQHAVSNSTVSAAADSSDNQPPTPTPDHQQPPAHQHHQQQQQQQQHHHLQHPLYGSSAGIGNANQMYQDMHSYHPPAGSYLGGYDQFYHAPPAGMDYGSAMQQLQQNSILPYQMQNQSSAGAPSPHGDYKIVPPTQRFHPYVSNGSLHHLAPAGQNNAVAAAVSVNNAITVNNTSSSVSNSSLSPRVVSSSSPSQNNSAATTGASNNAPHHGMPDAMTNRTPTPSASKQCNKCGAMCATDAELNEHYSAIHGAQSAEDCINSAERSTSSAPDRGQYHTFAPYIKEEPPSADILDLDSQKMVYPQHSDGDIVGGVNPGLHAMQRPMAWPQDLHPSYMAGPHVPEMKNSGYYGKQEFNSVKTEFHPIKSEYGSPPNFGNPSMKADYGQPIAPQTRSDDKPFGNTDLATGSNPVSSSPSEFPSTTTPQDNLTQYRGFEPPSSSLPSSGGSAKSATWKSNEARRPKTYNCTACNKWFTSSGHLKRHYNTTLHKNAVKSSGQPDPATMPISAHHHPSRDPNSKHHRNSQSRQPPPIPPEPPRSPDFSSQYTTQSPNGFPSQAQQQQTQAFQQYHPQSNLNSSVNGHPNGLAGPSVQASQPRGLLTITSTEVSIMEQEEDQLHINHNSNSSNNSTLQLQQEDHYLLHHQQRELQGPSRNNSPNSSSSLEEYRSVINLQQQQQSQQQQLPLQSPHIISHHQYQELHPIHHQAQEHTIFSTGTTIHNIMEQQPQQQQPQYIISPLAINTTTPITLNNTTTTIPSFQHLQQPAPEHQQSYHTIIGNDHQNLNGSSQDPSLIQLSSFVDLATLTNAQPFATNCNSNQLQSQIVTLDANGQVMQMSQPLVEIQRYAGGIPSFKESLMPTASVSESYYARLSPFSSQSSPQEADMPPMHNTASGPPMEQNPYSPTVSSSTVPTQQLTIVGAQAPAPAAAVGQVPATKAAPANTNKKAASQKRKRETTQKAAPKVQPPGSITCVECNKVFTKICYLTQHNKTFHSGEQPFRCQKCGKRFPLEGIYLDHLKRHGSQDKPHKCDLCPKQFHHKTDLRRHREAIHTGFKAHTCPDCLKSFCRKDHLRKHSDIHNRPKVPKKAKSTAASRKAAAAQQRITIAASVFVAEHNSSGQTIDDSLTNSNSPPQDIKIETFTLAGNTLMFE